MVVARAERVLQEEGMERGVVPRERHPRHVHDARAAVVYASVSQPISFSLRFRVRKHVFRPTAVHRATPPAAPSSLRCKSSVVRDWFRSMAVANAAPPSGHTDDHR